MRIYDVAQHLVWGLECVRGSSQTPLKQESKPYIPQVINTPVSVYSQLSGPDKEHRLDAACGVLSNFLHRCYQRIVQGLWRQYKHLVEEGNVSSLQAFWEEFQGHGHPRN